LFDNLKTNQICCPSKKTIISNQIKSPLLQSIPRDIAILIDHLGRVYLPVARNTEQGAVRPLSGSRPLLPVLSSTRLARLLVLQMKVDVVTAVVVTAVGQRQRGQMSPLLGQREQVGVVAVDGLCHKQSGYLNQVSVQYYISEESSFREKLFPFLQRTCCCCFII